MSVIHYKSIIGCNKEDETIPEDEPNKAEDNLIPEEHFEGEGGMNTPTASMRNIVKHVQTGKEDKNSS